MERYIYPALLEELDGEIVVSFRDVPEALTGADNRVEAAQLAADALVTALAGYLAEGRNLPRPSRKQKGETMIPLPALAAAKIALNDAFAGAGMTQAQLGEAIGRDGKEARRLLSLDHASKIEMVETALHALGQRLVISTEKAA